MLCVCAFTGYGVIGAEPAYAEPSLGTWCELTNSEFHLISDLNAESQTKLLTRLGQFHALVEPYLPGAPVARPGPLKIVVFARSSDFRRLTGVRKFAGFMQPSLQTNRLLIGAVQGSLLETAQHEYAHYLLRSRRDISLPLWFDEGLSSLLGAVEFKDTEAIIGRLPINRLKERMVADNRVFTLNEAPLSSFTRSINAGAIESWSERKLGAFYDWSWLLTHYLYFGSHGDAEPRYDLENYLANGRMKIADHLKLSERALLRRLDRYLRHPPTPVRISIEMSGEAVGKFHCLSDFERDHELADAILVQYPEKAREILAPHIETHQDDVDLLVTRSRIELFLDNPTGSQELSEAALSSDPGSANAMILAANISVQGCLLTTDEDCRDRWGEAADLYRAALKQDVSRFDAALGLGLANLYTGRPGEAVNYLKVAYAKAPWAAVVNFYLGESYRLIGDTRATTYLRNAYQWANLPVWRILAGESLKLLGDPTVVSADSDAL
jgi:hypothetical protein